MPEVKTTVSEVTSTIAAILGAPTGENIISQTPKNNLFSNDKTPATKISDLEAEAAKKKAEEEAKAAAKIKAEEEAAAKKKEEEGGEKPKSEKKSEGEKTEGLATFLTKTEQEQKEEEQKNQGGRPEFQKQGLLQVMKDLIKEEKFVPLDDEKPMEEWTKEDYKEFIELNIEHRENKIKEEVPAAFYDSLPEEFQIAFNYYAQGGKDTKHILKVLSHAVEMGTLDPETEEGQENIVRNYLAATQWGDPAEIDDEIKALQDKSELEKKAKQFKPKLDAIQQQTIERNLKQAERERKLAEKEAGVYMQTIFKALEPGELAGIKLDKRTQGALYNGLVQPNYQSFTGERINELAHLLETKQFGAQKDPESIALALWVLKDKDGFLQKVREQGASTKAAEVAKKLKIEEASKGSARGDEDEQGGASRQVKKLQRKTNNIFK